MRKRPASAINNEGIPLGSRALAGLPTACEEKTVSPAARKEYLNYEKAFRTWASRNGRSIQLDHVEISLLDYLDTLMEQKKKCSDGEKVINAVLASMPDLDRKQIHRLARALKGYRKTFPTRSREPFPEELMAGTAAIAVITKNIESARRIVFMFYLKSRPGETARITAGDVHRPQGEVKFYTVTICPIEAGLTTKTQTFDDSLIVREPEFLVQMLESQKSGKQPGDLLFEQAYPQSVKVWGKCVKALGHETAIQYQL